MFSGEIAQELDVLLLADVLQEDRCFEPFGRQVSELIAQDESPSSGMQLRCLPDDSHRLFVECFEAAGYDVGDKRHVPRGCSPIDLERNTQLRVSLGCAPKNV